jgi:hypothetical protein
MFATYMKRLTKKVLALFAISKIIMIFSTMQKNI